MNIEIKSHIRDGEMTGSWDVIHDNKCADGLTWDEMLGIVAQLTMPEHKHCVNWLRTDQQKKKWEEELKNIKGDF